MRVSILGTGKLGKDIALLLSQSTKIHTINLIVTKSSFSQKKVSKFTHKQIVRNVLTKKLSEM